MRFAKVIGPIRPIRLMLQQVPLALRQNIPDHFTMHIGRCAFVPDGFGEGNVNQHVCIIRPAAKLDYKFLTYCLSAPWGAIRAMRPEMLKITGFVKGIGLLRGEKLIA